MREPDGKQIATFADALFRHAREGYISHRAFLEGTSKTFRISATPVTCGLSFVVDVAVDDARRAANNPKPVVFCPPICTFFTDKRATEKDVVEGLALSVECDSRPAQAQALLERVVGPPTISVLSGGKYVDPDTGELENKRHLHWRLRAPAKGEDLKALKLSRKLATRLVGGDPANNPICHPMRWPGSWHCKAEPTLCRIEKVDADREIDLHEALAALKLAAPSDSNSNNKSKANGHDKADPDSSDWESVLSGMLTGKNYHNAITAFAMKLLRAGTRDAAAVNLIRALMMQSSGPRDDRWHSRFNDIPRAVSTARAKIGSQQSGQQDTDAEKPTYLLDPWLRFIAPTFPLHTLPTVLANYVTTRSKVIGCDTSGLAMATLAAVSGALDHGFALKILRNGDWLASPRLWIVLVGDPSVKKTPIINAATRELDRLQAAAHAKYEADKRLYLANGGKAEKFDQEHPPFTRFIAYDATIEKVGIILAGQDRGILMKRDELAGWIGAMEKYSAGRGSAADRAFWLNAYDGGPYSVDRVTRSDLLIGNLSVSMLGGIQPARLAELRGLTSDGLLQRFLPVLISTSAFPIDQPATAEAGSYAQLLRRLAKLPPRQLEMSDAASIRMEQLRRYLFELEQTSGGLAEGFQGFVGKLAGVAGSLALILALVADHNATLVSEEIVDHVAELIENFVLQHGLEFYGGAAVSEPLQRIASYILTSGKERLVASDFTANVRDLRGLGLWELNRRLSPMVAGGWLTPGNVGPEARAWNVIPAVHELFRARTKDEERRKITITDLLRSRRKSTSGD
jgi:Protein of unknown function (DUF3987)